jgi:hypothetical protein
MKIAINPSIGGFVLPKTHVDALVQKGWILIDRFNYNQTDTERDINDEYMLPNEIMHPAFETEEHRLLDMDQQQLTERTHPDLIEVIETLGEGQNCKVIEVPDDANVYIFEYEMGYEAVHEKHRIWE